MQLTMLKGKIHRATVTDANLAYEGSITIDEDLMREAGILPFEQVDVYNIANGSRFTTYAIKAPRGSGEICVNGAAAHLVTVGDLIIICAYIRMEPHEAKLHQPSLIKVNANNKVRSNEPVAA